MTKQVFEVTVLLGPRKSTHWTVARSEDEVAELLQDTQEFDDGASILIRPADLESLARLTYSDDFHELIATGQELLAVAQHWMQQMLPHYATTPQREVFVNFYCFPKDKVNHAIGRTSRS